MNCTRESRRLSRYDDFVQCPYEESHLVPISRIQSHLNKCQKRHPGVSLVVCPYDATHHVRKDDLTKHTENECHSKMNQDLSDFYAGRKISTSQAASSSNTRESSTSKFSVNSRRRSLTRERSDDDNSRSVLATSQGSTSFVGSTDNQEEDENSDNSLDSEYSMRSFSVKNRYR